MRSDLDEIREVALLFCEHAVQAIERYRKLTDWDPQSVPECFIQSYILDHLGDRVSMNLEIPLPLLWVWAGRGEAVPADMGREVVDFVVSKSNSPIKSEQDVWAIVELKRHYGVGGDRWKLTTKILPYLDCAFGLALGVTEISPGGSWLDGEAEKEGLKLVRSAPKTIAGRDFVGFAYIHENECLRDGGRP